MLKYEYQWRTQGEGGVGRGAAKFSKLLCMNFALCCFQSIISIIVIYMFVFNYLNL